MNSCTALIAEAQGQNNAEHIVGRLVDGEEGRNRGGAGNDGEEVEYGGYG